MLLPQEAKPARRAPMRVLSLGFSRTGTASMKAALEILLKEPCYHGFELYDHVEHCAFWEDALDAKFSPTTTTTPSHEAVPLMTADYLDTVLAAYSAVADVPAICFAAELIAAYPDAKVVLVQRDTEAWFRSFDDNVVKHLYDPVLKVVAMLDRWFLGPVAGVHYRWAETWMGVKAGGGRAEGEQRIRAVAKGFYEQHYAHVRSITPPGRMLEYKLGSGWQPLCEFLGIKDVPGVEFPRVNETAALDETMRGVVRRGVRSAIWHFGVYACPVVVGLVAWWLWNA
ncbi:hypothetical protein Micbo1qcDRAFT_166164 [Microdochium bolleyi]|uniref:P-loop containing nucleoside triphosphate hydrolase protein n=1 Tax=Microdochium bolleyi TaxID=196109 RepID=A0A136IUY9_9PEZI|nr:hypothetical protein Micbo1qcDRAFT_166164 [Microdochium bolleyi]